MRRRQFITLLGGAAAWPLAARAQQPGKLPTIGYMGANTPSIEALWFAAFSQRLRELGWVDGRNVTIVPRWAEGRIERATEIVAEFIRAKVDVIMTGGTSNVAVAKQATAVVPIIFAAAGDPVGTGLVASLARPGGNVTGLSSETTELGPKKLEILREVVPGLHRLTIMGDVSSSNSVQEMGAVRAAAMTLGLNVAISEVRHGEDIVHAFGALKGQADALYVASSPLVSTNRTRINILAAGAQLPTMWGSREHVEAGGLMSYGTNFADLYRRAGDYVDKILRGTRPADMPVERPTKFELVINLTTAHALGLKIPEAFLARADEVIE
jgi:putative ABC transport system substrate-binding protein